VKRSVGRLVTGWTLAGVGALFAWAAYRLGARGMDTLRGGLEAGQWVALVGLVLLFVYGEGFLALDQRWVPKLVQRARRLRDEPGVLIRLLAPLYGLSLVGTERGELLRGWAGTLVVVGAVLTVRVFPEPWRGIVDLSVAAALVFGLVAIMRRVPHAVGTGE